LTYILCIDTATDICSVAVGYDHNCQVSINLPQGNKHSSGLTPLIQEVLAKATIELKDLSAIAISDGPGSYTGLRVGCSAAKALCYALDIPMIAISTLKALAWGTKKSIGPQLISDDTILMPTIDARRMEVYTSCYDLHLNQIGEIHNYIYDQESIDLLARKYAKIILSGDGAAKIHSLDLIVPDHILVYPTQCNAAHMCHLAYARYEEKSFADVAYHAPFYYKLPNITQSKKNF
jgi:tRNA threonylcarbamoyladenosine biosynthesis protein TsaB